jgi:hypothetical protein
MSIRRIIRLLVVGWIASRVAGTIAAVRMKGQLGANTDESSDEIAASAIFGPLAYRSTARRLRGGRLELWYGGGVLDLRDAALDPAGATLDVRAVFGGGQILVPADWKVISRLRGLGGLTDSRPARGYLEGAPALEIRGVVIAGGFAVMSELDADGAEWLAEMEAKQDAEAPSTVTTAAEPDRAESAAAKGSGTAATKGSESAPTETEMTPAG